MIDETTSKVDRKVDGKFSLTVGDNPNIFEDSSVVKELETQLETAKSALKKVRKDNILSVFNDIISEHVRKFGIEPTKCILNYREFNFLIEASNDLEGAKYQSTYADCATVLGITICKGCNTEPGEFRLETRV